MAVPGSRRHRAMVRFSAEPVRATRSLPPPHLAWRSPIRLERSPSIGEAQTRLRSQPDNPSTTTAHHYSPLLRLSRLSAALVSLPIQSVTYSTPLPQTPFPNSASA